EPLAVREIGKGGPVVTGGEGVLHRFEVQLVRHGILDAWRKGLQVCGARVLVSAVRLPAHVPFLMHRVSVLTVDLPARGPREAKGVQDGRERVAPHHHAVVARVETHVHRWLTYELPAAGRRQ